MRLAVIADRTGAFALAFVSLVFAFFAFEAESLRLVIGFAGAAFLATTLRATGLVVLAAVAFFVTFDCLVATGFAFATLLGDGLETEVVLGAAAERNFAFALTVVFAVAFVITLGRFESVSLIRIPL